MTLLQRQSTAVFQSLGRYQYSKTRCDRDCSIGAELLKSNANFSEEGLNSDKDKKNPPRDSSSKHQEPTD